MNIPLVARQVAVGPAILARPENEEGETVKSEVAAFPVISGRALCVAKDR